MCLICVWIKGISAVIRVAITMSSRNEIVERSTAYAGGSYIGTWCVLAMRSFWCPAHALVG